MCKVEDHSQTFKFSLGQNVLIDEATKETRHWIMKPMEIDGWEQPPNSSECSGHSFVYLYGHNILRPVLSRLKELYDSYSPADDLVLIITDQDDKAVFQSIVSFPNLEESQENLVGIEGEVEDVIVFPSIPLTVGPEIHAAESTSVPTKDSQALKRYPSVVGIHDLKVHILLDDGRMCTLKEITCQSFTYITDEEGIRGVLTLPCFSQHPVYDCLGVDTLEMHGPIYYDELVIESFRDLRQVDIIISGQNREGTAVSLSLAGVQFHGEQFKVDALSADGVPILSVEFTAKKLEPYRKITPILQDTQSVVEGSFEWQRSSFEIPDVEAPNWW